MYVIKCVDKLSIQIHGTAYTHIQTYKYEYTDKYTRKCKQTMSVSNICRHMNRSKKDYKYEYK